MQKVRKKLEIPQTDFAVLIGTPLATICSWEQKVKKPSAAILTLYIIISKADDNVFSTLVAHACSKQRSNLKEIESLKRLIRKLIKNKFEAALLQKMLVDSNPQWTPEQLGFRTTRIG